MIIHLPNDLESRLEVAVQSGRFASVDDAMAQAARLLLRELAQGRQAPVPGDANEHVPDPLLGSMSDHAELVDEIVEDAMRHREQQPWRLTPSE